MSKPHPSMALTLDLDESIVDHELRLEIDRCYSYLGTPVVRTHPAADGEPVNTLRMTVRVGAREYAATRGTHCSALFCRDEMVALYEDIGRHNTFDKLAGHCLTRGIDATGFLLATTGRVSSEMLRKAARLGVGTVASLSGPTDAAVREARGRGMTLAGYVNSSRLTLYAASTVTAVPEAVTMSMLP